ncbi:U7 snRNA-associated Sm-like protein LSm11 [Halyomorpha halys]|uniref:U7 snRNA-associated Sm-like protein LSm11 n=1 Tax=Halyomorpha halys TaxID=286706 RepID=UPI0006D5187E|nr:U7 snRNA-associated Sm-like protein LSm11 [Halyomorpha halys]XP_014286554.1 U7 snRNA-associated Sm-like protein LSm11 [Halyomorpha halys]XP_014286555.1 U7 snRNA-associated Sm-like protein LSm11 [Halyomorpha halys]XP_024214234.1 U7 snRNA-associated Sm-like protein LSm11 [Halyomorpha halys]
MGDKEEKDEKLNPLSSNFDPLSALYAQDIPIPNQDAPVYDNVAKFELTSTGLSVKQIRKKEKPVVEKAESFERDLPSTSLPTKPDEGKKNIRKFMLNVEGPLAKLREMVENRTRIKVTTRSAWGIRGYVIAYLSAFDKMWNLALEDVTEVWIRKIKKKTPALAETRGSPRHRVSVPPVTVTKVGPKNEQCERYVPKLMMRGEHVAIIQCL